MGKAESAAFDMVVGVLDKVGAGKTNHNRLAKKSSKIKA